MNKLKNKGLLTYRNLNDTDKYFIDFCPAKNVGAEVVNARCGSLNCSEPNNCSVVVKVIYGNNSFLFAGDAEDEEENALLGNDKMKMELNADVFKACHHGSCTSNTLDFLKAVSPVLVIVSSGQRDVGTNRGYKHPQLFSLNNFNTVLTTAKYRKDKIEVYDHDHSKWVKAKAKEGIYYTKIDSTVEIIGDGIKVWKN